MMMKRMWYELNILALRKHVRPVSLFLLVHTLLWLLRPQVSQSLLCLQCWQQA